MTERLDHTYNVRTSASGTLLLPVTHQRQDSCYRQARALHLPPSISSCLSAQHLVFFYPTTVPGPLIGYKMNSHPTPSTSVPLFAVIIGIDDYDSKHLGPAYNLQPLKGAVADAQSFKRWLEEWRGVPSDHIMLLTNKAATCSAIIDALTKLKTDTRIRPGDPIFIYYAGHGTEIKGPESWECGRADKMIQAIVPYDCDTLRSGNRVAPISDRTFGALIGNIAEKKGNNIFVVFDCCHSGSGTRGVPGSSDDDDSRDTARAANLTRDYSAILEQQLRNTGVHELTASAHNRFIHYAMESHVLLSACGEMEEAFETPVKDDIYTTKRGRFSMALLKLLYEMPIDKLRYSDILDHLDPIPHQNPNCVGNHNGRFIFNSKVPPARRKAFAVQYQSQTRRYVLHAGNIQKVNPQSTFALFLKSDVDFTRQLGTLSVANGHIGQFLSQATVTPEIRLDPEQDIVAVPVKSGTNGDLNVFIAPNDNFHAVYQRLKEDHGLENVTLTNTLKVSNIGISMAGNKITFTLCSLPCPNVMPFKWQQVVQFGSYDSSALELVGILSRAAHFYRELRLIHKVPDDVLEVRFYELVQAQSSSPWTPPEFVPAQHPKDLYSNGIVTILYSPDAKYGIKLINKTELNLYANVFYFVNQDLSIVERAVSPPAAAYKRDPCLRPKEALTIGWGAAGYQPDICKLKEDEDYNIEFLKIYISTHPVNLAYLPQTSPFSMSSGRGMEPFQPTQQGEWAELVIPVVQRRPGIVNAGRRN
ncbi:hypothetical protein HYPSUDRAFT_214125 [Hypholoma sublateritium FD-334 SS-4]|uniref:Peptidase C14 caspase domain-containing protein n=1 Tax=Hypholoma sublateritium (strain FD-334 SS-4) TaxID=945553 RepID=A0A0D2P2B4_HYPSF|nr:hypothetical protein HYPSUDRAFT_214125 [Hypholoma sublateritium FD-334 SS-4]